MSDDPEFFRNFDLPEGKKINELTGEFEDLDTALGMVGKEIAQVVDNLSAFKVSEPFEELADSLKEAEVAVHGITQNLEPVKDSKFKKGMKAFGGAITNSVLAVTPLGVMSSIFERLTPLMEPFNAIMDIFGGLIEIIAAEALPVLMEALSPFMDILMNLTPIFEILGTVLGTVMEIGLIPLRILFEVITSVITPLLPFLESFSVLWEKIGGVVGTLADTLLEDLKPVFDLITIGVGIFAEILMGAMPFLEKIIDGITWFTDIVSVLIGLIFGQSPGLIPAFQGIIDMIGMVIGFIGDIISNMMSFGQDIMNFFGDAFNNVNNFIGDIFGGLKDAGDKALSFIADAGKEAFNFLKDAGDNVLGFFEDLIGGIFDFFGDVTEAGTGFFEDVFGLQEGGLVLPPGGVFQVAEAGIPEVVIPLPDFLKTVGGGLGGGNIELISVMEENRNTNRQILDIMHLQERRERLRQ